MSIQSIIVPTPTQVASLGTLRDYAMREAQPVVMS
jgi:hypothetical protein